MARRGHSLLRLRLVIATPIKFHPLLLPYHPCSSAYITGLRQQSAAAPAPLSSAEL